MISWSPAALRHVRRQPAVSRAARRIDFGRGHAPTTQIGTRGRCTGGGGTMRSAGPRAVVGALVGHRLAAPEPLHQLEPLVDPLGPYPPAGVVLEDPPAVVGGAEPDGQDHPAAGEVVERRHLARPGPTAAGAGAASASCPSGSAPCASRRRSAPSRRRCPRPAPTRRTRPSHAPRRRRPARPPCARHRTGAPIRSASAHLTRRRIPRGRRSRPAAGRNGRRTVSGTVRRPPSRAPARGRAAAPRRRS